MKFTVLQPALKEALARAARAIDNRPTMPIIGNVLLETDSATDTLRVSGTNLELTVITGIGAKVEVDGRITLPHRVFAELVGNLPNDRIDFSLDAATLSMRLKAKGVNTTIRGLSADDFPPIATSFDASVLINAVALREAITQTIFSIARDDARPTLTGLYTRFDDNTLVVAAADGFRLAVKTTPIEYSDEQVTLLVPGSAMEELARILTNKANGNVEIDLFTDARKVAFAYDGSVIVTTLIEGKFPDFNAIVPKSSSTIITVNRDDMLKSCKRAEIFARDSNNSVRFDADYDVMRVTGKSAERGDNEGDIAAHLDGEPLTVAYNVKYFMDVLSVLTAQNVAISTNGAKHPAIISPEGDASLMCIVMPMSINQG